MSASALYLLYAWLNIADWMTGRTHAPRPPKKQVRLDCQVMFHHLTWQFFSGDRYPSLLLLCDW